MFNLIVSAGPDASLQGSIIAGRVFEYTDEPYVEQFKPGGTLDVSAILALPTLYMQEGEGNEVARIVTLTRLELHGRDYQFRYAIDPDVPALSNAEVLDMQAELGIGNFEFHRNHWAVKGADLFQVLLRKKAAKLPRPTVFELSENPVRANLISLMMPFSGSFGAVYDEIKTKLEATATSAQEQMISGCMPTSCKTSSN